MPLLFINIHKCENVCDISSTSLCIHICMYNYIMSRIILEFYKKTEIPSTHAIPKQNVHDHHLKTLSVKTLYSHTLAYMCYNMRMTMVPERAITYFSTYPYLLLRQFLLLLPSRFCTPSVIFISRQKTQPTHIYYRNTFTIRRYSKSPKGTKTTI